MEKIELVIDQRYDGVSKEAVERDQDREAFVSSLAKRIVESDNKTQLMDELFAKEVRFSIQGAYILVVAAQLSIPVQTQ